MNMQLIGVDEAGTWTCSGNKKSQTETLGANPVADVLIDGERLAGKGVAPDIQIPFSIPYAHGKDPQLEKAIEVLLEAANSN